MWSLISLVGFVLVVGLIWWCGKGEDCCIREGKKKKRVFPPPYSGIQQLIIELDALSVVILLNNDTENSLMESLLTDCRNLLKEFPCKPMC